MADKSKKNISIFGVVSIGIGSMLGAGIFALLGQVILKAGDKVYLSFALAGAIAVLSGYSYSKLAKLYPESGGITDYFNHAFKNRFWSGLFSGVYLATLCISIAMLGKSFGIYATTVLKLSSEYIALFSIVVIATLGLFNIKGKNIGKTEVILVALKLSILIILVSIAFYRYFAIEKPPLIDHSSLSLGFWKSVSFAFFAYAGYGVMTNAAEEVDDPKRTIPLAIFIAILSIIVIYMSLAFVVMKYAPIEDLHKNVDIAIATASNAILGKQGFLIISIAAIIALLSGINALFYSSYKIMTNMCKNKELPAFVNKKVWDNGSIGMFLIIICMSIASFSLDFSFIATIASSAFLISYIAVFIAHIFLFKKSDSSLFLIIIGLIGMTTVFVLSFAW